MTFFNKPRTQFRRAYSGIGMDENCIMERLIDEQLFSYHFPEAKNIIWNAEYLYL